MSQSASIPHISTSSGSLQERMGLMVFGGWRIIATPLRCALRVVCPPCELGRTSERLYVPALIVSLAWVVLLSFVVVNVVDDWSARSGTPAALWGITLVAMGVQGPDTVQSIMASRRGWGDHVISNLLGAQSINGLLGIGILWLVAAIRGTHVEGIGQLCSTCGDDGDDVAQSQGRSRQDMHRLIQDWICPALLLCLVLFLAAVTLVDCRCHPPQRSHSLTVDGRSSSTRSDRALAAESDGWTRLKPRGALFLATAYLASATACVVVLLV